MNNNNISPLSVAGSVSLIICIVIRALSCLLQSGAAANYIFYIAVLITLCIVYLRSRHGQFSSASELKKELAPYALLFSLGFMIDFINSLVTAVKQTEEAHFNRPQFFALIAAGVFALLSSLYFIAVYLSCGKTAYDFKKLKILPFMPLMWSVSLIVGMITDALSFKSDVFMILKSTFLIFAALFFYCFISECENEGEAKRQTVFISKAFFYIALLLFFSRCFELIGKTAVISDSETFFALSALTMGLFAHFYRKQITNA